MPTNLHSRRGNLARLMIASHVVARPVFRGDLCTAVVWGLYLNNEETGWQLQVGCNAMLQQRQRLTKRSSRPQVPVSFAPDSALLPSHQHFFPPEFPRYKRTDSIFGQRFQTLVQRKSCPHSDTSRTARPGNIQSVNGWREAQKYSSVRRSRR